ncbi:arginine repressor, ArgR [Spirochaeta thermophila DSM 6578]|uniref:Arginine repressor n=1 Tax=Winmispira thermophila (strain ATCC 700085 / DSM 6578 / Z-1203) TaxID=869211 RepID=G0GEH2_WINT7|nr:ArgR family transcriptional regulator [Spirochaeta thermophila]AEJ62309.1 arginine repressor, ArgR [Spirochaeta thermophila DSM 6578]
MKGREERLKLIRQIIRSSRVRSQEELLERLAAYGHRITQATLSRDLKLLKVGKVAEGENGYYYILPGENETEGEVGNNFVQDFIRGFRSLEFSGNLAVIRTLPGHANSVAFALDTFQIPSLLGTVAGDDTIIAVLKEGTSREAFLETLSRYIPSFRGA